MAKGDRVIIGTGYHFQRDPEQLVMVYMPQLNESNNPIETPDGSLVVTKAGGVVCGTTGVILGEARNVHRSYLHNSGDYTAPAYGNDFVKLVPVMLNEYQQIGWFPVDNVRLFAGGAE